MERARGRLGERETEVPLLLLLLFLLDA